MPEMHLRTPRFVDEFTAFLLRGNVVDLAVGIVIGAAFTAIVNSVVRDIFNPLMGLALGSVDFSNFFITLRGPVEPTLEAARTAGAVTLNVGVFVNTVIQFIIVGAAVFMVVKALARLHLSKTLEKPAPPKQEVLLEEIRDLLAERTVAAPKIG